MGTQGVRVKGRRLYAPLERFWSLHPIPHVSFYTDRGTELGPGKALFAFRDVPAVQADPKVFDIRDFQYLDFSRSRVHSDTFIFFVA